MGLFIRIKLCNLVEAYVFIASGNELVWNADKLKNCGPCISIHATQIQHNDDSRRPIIHLEDQYWTLRFIWQALLSKGQYSIKRTSVFSCRVFMSDPSFLNDLNIKRLPIGRSSRPGECSCANNLTSFYWDRRRNLHTSWISASLHIKQLQTLKNACIDSAQTTNH
jgi:hypothetical protein